MIAIINKFMNVNRSIVKPSETWYLTPRMYNMIKSQVMKRRQKDYFLFFYRLYQCCCQMDNNTSELQKMNKAFNLQNNGTKHGYSHAWMLDDVPGVIDRCGGDYGSKKWPYCPGIESVSGRDEDSPELNAMVFRRR